MQPPTSHHPLLVTAVNTVGYPQSILQSVSQLETPPHRGAGLYLSSSQLLLSYLVKADKVHLATSLATSFHDQLIVKCICRVKSSRWVWSDQTTQSFWKPQQGGTSRFNGFESCSLTKKHVFCMSLYLIYNKLCNLHHSVHFWKKFLKNMSWFCFSLNIY